MDLKRTQFSIDSKILQHELIAGPTDFGSDSKLAANSSGNVFGHLSFKGFCELLKVVDDLSRRFMGLAECALISNVARLRELHPDRKWRTDQIKSSMQVFEAVKEFARAEGIYVETAVLDGLEELVKALEPALSHNQKQCYGAIKVLVQLYSEGKELPNVAEVVQNMPKPTTENKCFFVFIRKLLASISIISQISNKSSVENCIDVYGPLADVLGQ